MRAANLFLFLGTVGFINIYEELAGEDELTPGKLDPSDAKRLQRKFGVKEKRSPNSQRQEVNTQALTTVPNIEEYTEELIEHLKRPVYRGLSACGSADGNLCNCLRLICFGQAECSIRSNASLPASDRLQQPQQSPVPVGDPRYVYFATGERLRARHEAAGGNSSEDHFVRCRQTTIDPYVLCECKAYTRNRLATRT